ncbi:GTP-binding protein [Kineococcus rhizosphaerae]|uniref:Elongation factor Tu-like protein n=1 Tax=Kineococcus rhizosphaerae TaxID=559628 RepID=A0A2T0R9P2_9ACTN|nr:GTP-binding protein [Kineococcus rhizosphaerae]PRY17885.1 elongation factor Tu-like protein [Kineococcus rhizosphaerae]
MSRAARKIVVTGPFGAGKTTFATTLTQGLGGTLTTTETGVSDETAALKTSTTVALDHTSFVVPPAPASAWDATHVTLFGTPGQQRFSFTWELLARNMDGYLVLVDASRSASIAQAADVVAAFARIAPATPRLVAVSRWPDPAGTRTHLAQLLGTAPTALVACDPRDLAQSAAVLRLLLDGVHTLENRRTQVVTDGVNA